MGDLIVSEEVDGFRENVLSFPRHELAQNILLCNVMFQGFFSYLRYYSSVRFASEQLVWIVTLLTTCSLPSVNAQLVSLSDSRASSIRCFASKMM